MGASAWVCEACGTRGGERGGKLPTDGDGAAVVGIFWDSPRNPALSPHLSSAMQGGILRETSLSWVVGIPRILYAAEQLRRSGHPPAAAATLCGDLPSLCAHPENVLVPATFLLVAAVGTLGVGMPTFRAAPLLPGSLQTAEFGAPPFFVARASFPLFPSPSSQAEV